MKIILFDKILDLILKKTKSGEKEQELQIKKQEIFNKLMVILTLIFVSLCAMNEIFPIIELSPWWYSTTEKILEYLTK
ncbi:MAG: hypothetical protein ACRCW9_01905 [Cetobacterium sp.]